MALDNGPFETFLRTKYEKELNILENARKKRKDLDNNDLKAMYQLKLISKDQYYELANQQRQLAAEQKTEQAVNTLDEGIERVVTKTIDNEMDEGLTIQNEQEKDTIITPAKEYKKTSERREKPVFDEKRYVSVKKKGQKEGEEEEVVLGQGGMGKVVLRKDTKMGKDLADKTILAKKATRQHEERFKREIDITKKFKHPYIIGAQDYGYDSAGNLHFLMDFVKGKEFSKIIDEICEGRTRKYPLSEVLQLFLKVIDAVDYMHERDIIHRDLKPDNVFVDEFGQVKIMDFGLAKDLKLDELLREEDTKLDSDKIKRTGVFTTQQGLIMGTPTFMAPEQAKDSTKVDGRADIYSLGAMLYEIIVGEPPHIGKSVQNTLYKVVNEEIKEPIARAAKNYDIPAELNAIIMKALDKDPKYRYRKASDFADDIRAFLSNDPVSVYKDTLADKISKFSKKKPGKFMTIALGIPAAFLLTAAIGIGIFAYNASEARKDAAQARAELADKEKEKAKLEAMIKGRERDAAVAELRGQSASQAKLESLKFLRQDEGYNEAALAVINQAVSDSPEYWRPYLFRAKHLAEQGKHTEAEQDFLKANSVFKKQFGKESTEIWFEAGMYYGLPNELGGRKMEAKALPYFELAAKDKESTFGKLARAVELILKAGMKPEEAEEYLEEADELTRKLTLDEVAQSIDATFYVRAWLLGTGVFEETNQESFNAYMNPEEAKKYLLRVISEDRGPVGARSFLALIYADTGDIQKAIQIYTELLKIQEQPYLYYNRGNCYYKAEMLEEAIQDYTRAIDIPGDSSGIKYSCHYNRGLIFLIKKGEYQTAINDFSKAMALKPRTAEHYCSRGLAYFYLGDYENAFSDFQKDIELNPRSWRSLEGISAIKTKQKNYEEAIEYRKRALEYAPPTNKESIATAIKELEQAIRNKK